MTTALPTLYEYYTSGGITEGLNANQTYFTLNQKNITLFSGALHYYRVPQPYWRDRLKKMRAAGLNAVETYVPWNLHEPQSGVYDFGNGGSDFQEMLNLETFLKTAQEEDLLAIVRPGPYICTEFEFGGLPSWLLRETGIKLRTSNATFINYVKRFFDVLLPILVALQFTKGGPIVAIQIENEYGNANSSDKDYLNTIKEMLETSGIVELLFTSDTPSYGTAGSLPGVLNTANFQNNSLNELQTLLSYQPDKPVMVMEYWSGWYDHWTDEHHTVSVEFFSNVLETILSFPASVNFYMFHGGTSWGFLNGANNEDFVTTNNSKFQPDTSSYDYDSPLTEAGDYTDKYYSLKSIIENYTLIETLVPEMPTETARVAFDAINITQQIPFINLIENNAEHEISSTYPIAMELLPINNNSGQSYGYIVYRKEGLDIPANSVLTIEGHVCDTVMVLINGKLVSDVITQVDELDGFGYWRLANPSLNLGSVSYTNATLDLLVENWGRVNFGFLNQFYQFKGLWQGNITLNDNVLTDWKLIPLEFKKQWTNNLIGWQTPNFENGPSLYKGILNVETPSDTFIDMRKWRKGIVILNGFVLSRYFRFGPQQTAYAPAPFFVTGNNEIVIFEHFVPTDSIQFSKDIIYETITKIDSNTSSASKLIGNIQIDFIILFLLMGTLLGHLNP